MTVQDVRKSSLCCSSVFASEPYLAEASRQGSNKGSDDGMLRNLEGRSENIPFNSTQISIFITIRLGQLINTVCLQLHNNVLLLAYFPP